jgi:hypothetical protein
MKEKIDNIFHDLKNEIITEKQAHQQILDLFEKFFDPVNCFTIDDIKTVYEIGRSAGKKKNVLTSEQVCSAFLEANKMYKDLRFE